MSKKRRSVGTRSVIYGVHPVLETLKAGKRVVDEIYLSREAPLEPVARASLEARGIPITSVSADALASLAGSPHHQGLAARVGPFPYAELEDLLEQTSPTRGLILVLDEVQDPGNLGSIIRSGECLAAAGIVIAKDRAVPITASVEKSAAGATAYIPVARVVNLVTAMEALKDAGYWVYGTAASARESVYDLDLIGRVAFVLGSEGKGMRRLVRERCDGLVSIPMRGRIDSLNVSQTATVLLSEALRQRLAAGAGHSKEP